MSSEQLSQCLITQMQKVQDQHPDLELILMPSGIYVVQGFVRFSVEHNGHTVKDEYNVAITIPENYPESPPVAWEKGNAIPKSFHHYKAGNLCLGAPIEVRRVFAQDKTLVSYINRQLIPYLSSYSYFRDFERMPYGELPHIDGILMYYKEFFCVNRITAMKLLKLLADNFAPPLMRCPCDSGKSLQDCHGPYLDELRPHYTPKEFKSELIDMISATKAVGIRFSEKQVVPQKLWRKKIKSSRKLTM